MVLSLRMCSSSCLSFGLTQETRELVSCGLFSLSTATLTLKLLLIKISCQLDITRSLNYSLDLVWSLVLCWHYQLPRC